jgi:biotin synthase-related radical SAM superfamily protein
MNDNEKEFLAELKALMEKYNAAIGFNVGEGSDTHGLYEEEIHIDVNNKTIHKTSGWWISGEDLE